MKNKSRLLKIIKYIFVTTGERHPCKNMLFKKNRGITKSFRQIRENFGIGR